MRDENDVDVAAEMDYMRESLWLEDLMRAELGMDDDENC